MTGSPPLKGIIRETGRIALPYFRSAERWSALVLLVAIVGVQLGAVGIAVATNYWRNAFFQTLQSKDWPGFVHQFWIYCLIGVGFILCRIYQRYLTQWLSIRWRRWLTGKFLENWLQGPSHYRTALASGGIDNPDQRIADDVREFIDQLLELGSGLIGAVASLASFVAILWSLSDLIPLKLFGTTYPVPGYLVWAALLYALLGSIVTHIFGRRLIPIDYEQERREADFRFALVRVRERGESIALLGGEAAERQDLLSRFAALMRNWYRLMRLQQFVGLFTETYRYYSIYFPYLVMAPLFFSGGMPFGALMQSGSAFNTVRESFSYFIASYFKIAALAATVHRLGEFTAALDASGAAASRGSSIGNGAPTANALSVRDLVVTTANARVMATLPVLDLRKGEAVLLTGRSGTGKTSVLRVMAGVWPHYAGQVLTNAARTLVLPQNSYLPIGALRRIITYPQQATAFDDADLVNALAEVGLLHLGNLLDRSDAWEQRLSEGEKQRLSVARVLLYKPDLLLMDEATASLDEEAEHELHKLVRSRLPTAAILAVSHRKTLSAIYDRSIMIGD